MQIKEKNSSYYELQNKRSFASFNNNKVHRYLDKIQVKDKATFSILDIGCRSNAGTVKYFIENGFPNSYGIDIGERAEAAWESYPFKNNLKRQDVHEGIPFNINFDLISCSHTLEHCHNPELVLSLIYHNLKPDGYYWSQVPLGSHADTKNHEPHFCHFDSAEEHINLLTKIGFSINFILTTPDESCVLARKGK